MQLSQDDFEQILKIGIELSAEKNENRILASILENGMAITHCDAGTVYLYEEGQLVSHMMQTVSLGINRGGDGKAIADLPPVPMQEKHICAYTAIHREIVQIPDIYDSDRFDFSGQKCSDSRMGYHTTSMLTVPVQNHEKELIGVLQMMNAQNEKGDVVPFENQYHLVIQSLASLAAIELTNLRYVEEIKAQLHSFVEAMATAIDERTPYNGTHTRKVAEYAEKLAKQINQKHAQGKCAEYFDEERMEILLLAALLHDIGKMIVPLSVMNRATRLDRDLAKIEDRFELLRTFYEVDMLRGRITKAAYEEKMRELDDDLALIYEINGMGILDDVHYEKVCILARKKHRKTDGTVTPYITQQEAKYLKIRRGTLTDEDRKQMEGHVVMTGKILSKVHFNRQYQNVQKWAASHHEFLDGTGYPDHLTADRLDLESRILTVADIYDALTARDRPYKKPMPREQAMEILRSMAADGKIEPDLVNWLDEAL